MWHRDQGGAAENQHDALEEARLAVEEIVLPRSQVIELLPRSRTVIELQVSEQGRYRIWQNVHVRWLLRRTLVSVASQRTLLLCVQIKMLHGYDVGVELVGKESDSSARLRIMPAPTDIPTDVPTDATAEDLPANAL